MFGVGSVFRQKCSAPVSRPMRCHMYLYDHRVRTAADSVATRQQTVDVYVQDARSYISWPHFPCGKS